jgi:predicted nucleic acid-binding protein
MTIVFDTNVVVEAIFWPRSTARRALSGLARRQFQTVVNSAIMEEYATITAQVRKNSLRTPNPPARWPGSLQNPCMSNHHF